jgi:hypothetical protein
MTDREKLALIYRVVSGYTQIGPYIVDTATDSLKNESLLVRSNTIYQHRFEELLTEEEAEGLLIRKRMWSPADSTLLKELEKSLDNAKVELYNNYGMPSAHLNKIRNQLTIIKQKQIEQLNKRHCLDRFSLEYLGEYAAELYLFSKTVLDQNYQPVKLGAHKLQNIMFKYKSLTPSNTDMRLIARTEPWRSFWSTSPSGFRVLGDDQRVLILFSKMYDNVYEHHERPPEGVINDDDMLDGWFIAMKRKNEKAKADSAKNIVTERHPGAGEIFMMVKSEEEAREVEMMNDVRGKVIKGQLNEVMKHKELVKDWDVPAIRMENNG